MNRYTPSTRTRLGVFSALRMLWRDVKLYWPQIVNGMRNDWSGIYKGSYLGAFWAVVMAILPMSVYVLLSILKIFPSGGPMPRAVYVSAGITIWMVIAQTITVSMGGVAGAARTVSGAQDPVAVGLVSQYGMLLFDTLLRFLALVAWMLISGVPLRWSLLLFPGLMLPVFLFAIGLGMVLASFNVVVSDVKPLTGMVLRYAIFFSFVIFPLPDSPVINWVTDFNMAAHFIDGIREMIVLGSLTNVVPFVVTCVLGLVVFVLGVRTFYRLEPHIVEHV